MKILDWGSRGVTGSAGNCTKKKCVCGAGSASQGVLLNVVWQVGAQAIPNSTK